MAWWLSAYSTSLSSIFPYIKVITCLWAIKHQSMIKLSFPSWKNVILSTYAKQHGIS